MKKIKILLSVLTTIFTLTSCVFNQPKSTEDIDQNEVDNTEEKYTITFNTNGGTLIESQIVKKGSKVDKPQDPIKNGYTFNFWTYSNEEWLFNDYQVNNDITLEANYNIITYTITYDLYGGTLETSNPSEYTVEDEILLNNPSKTGYKFVGWYDNQNNEIETISKGTTGNILLTARWRVAESYVYFDTNGGNLISPVFGTYGDLISLPIPIKENSLFAGWYIDKMLTQEANLTSIPENDTTLYAKWTDMYTLFKYHSKQYIYFGSYPQSIVSNNSLLNELSELTTINQRGYFEYEGKEYAKKQVNAAANYAYSNGSEIIFDKIEYFKVEPILWQVIEIDVSGNYTLLAEQTLNAQPYRDSSVSTSEQHTYKESTLRSWMNSTFLNTAFISAEKENILTTTVNNSSLTTDSNINERACANTNDKIFLLSYQDYINADFGFSINYSDKDTNRFCHPTDYALANYCMMPEGWTRNCYYWTRSPYSQGTISSWVVYYDGSLVPVYDFESGFGIRPALNINLKK